MCHATHFSARALTKKFLDVDIVVTNKPKCGLAGSVVLATTIQWSKFVLDSFVVHYSLTIVMTRVVVGKSTHYAKALFTSR